MRFIDHPFVLSVVFLIGVAGSSLTILLIIEGFVVGDGFRASTLLFGFLWGWTAWSAGTRLFGFKPTLIRLELEKYATELMALPYDKALEHARAHCIQVPYGLARRKIQPAAKEWHAFEKDGILFWLEKCESSGGTKVTFHRRRKGAAKDEKPK